MLERSDRFWIDFIPQPAKPCRFMRSCNSRVPPKNLKAAETLKPGGVVLFSRTMVLSTRTIFSLSRRK